MQNLGPLQRADGHFGNVCYIYTYSNSYWRLFISSAWGVIERLLSRWFPTP